MVHARDQAALDRYLAGRIHEAELRRLIRHEVEWGYPWAASARLLRRARAHGVPVLGLDLPPRGGVESLARRDRAAAERIAALADTLGPGGTAVVVFGEAHLAAPHLPRALARHGIEGDALARVFHDLDEAGVGPGWRRAGNATFVRRRAAPGSRAPAFARVVQRWAREEPAAPDLDVPLFVHGLIDALAQGVGIDPRGTRAGRARWLADLFPVVFGPRERGRFVDWLTGTRALATPVRAALDAAEARGATFVPEANAIFLARPSLMAALAQGALFLAGALAPGRDPATRAGRGARCGGNARSERGRGQRAGAARARAREDARVNRAGTCARDRRESGEKGRGGRASGTGW
ncbi:MAG: hypothetical protein H6Q01_981 [Acidobacteria bacterium]|nr:hypothetical protein [Acidobacteriota bacterium]